MYVFVHFANINKSWDPCLTAILIITEGHETDFNGFYYQFTAEKPFEKPETDPQLLREWQ